MGSRADGDLDRPAHRRGGLRGRRRRARGRTLAEAARRARRPALPDDVPGAAVRGGRRRRRGSTSRSAWPPSCGSAIPGCSARQSAESAGDARNQWEDVKVESEGREGIFHDVPRALPALLEARKIQRRAAAIGFEYATAADAFGDLESEVRRAARRAGTRRARARARAAGRGRSASSATCSSPASTSRGGTTAIPSSRCAPPRRASASASSSPSSLADAEGVVFRAVGAPQQEHYYQAAKRSLREAQ